MAGSYPDVPGRRIAWDDDGTVVLETTHDAPVYSTHGDGPEAWANALAAGEQTDLQGEDVTANITVTQSTTSRIYIGLIFPELRDLDGVHINGFGEQSPDDLDWAEYSADTTNGIDGTWAELIDSGNANWVNNSTADSYRDDILGVTFNGVRGVKVQIAHTTAGSATAVARTIHLYGEIASGETPDRILMWDEITSLEFTLPKDYGDVPRGSARDFEMRLRNNSASLSAGSVDGDGESLFGGSDAWYTFDVASAGFGATFNITSIGSASNSGLITVRQDIADAASPGPHVARLQVGDIVWT